MASDGGKTHYYGDSCPTGAAGRGGHFEHSGGSFTAHAGIGGPCCLLAERISCACMEAYKCKQHPPTHIGSHD